jgi:hypothetical protein
MSDSKRCRYIFFGCFHDSGSAIFSAILRQQNSQRQNALCQVHGGRHVLATGQRAVQGLAVQVSRWGEEKLLELINNAPRNTIFVAGMSFVSGKSIRTEVAGVRVVISSTCEFLERFGFNYIVTDESHKAKNLRSITHQRIKKMYCMPSLRYLRIATGTMIMDRLRDIVAQVALLSPTVFAEKQ